MSKPAKLQGQTFGFLKVIKELPERKHQKVQWLCKCMCGETTVVDTGHLRSGHTTSCGCQHYVRESEFESDAERKAAHAHWDMLRRCYDDQNPRYRDYGGRGIRVCRRWQGENGRANFLADMGAAPEETSLDRINNDKGYTPTNCRWATRTEQQNNRRNNVKLTLNHRTLTLTQWADELGVRPGLITKRLKLGWSVKEALTIPIQTAYQR